MYTLPQALDSPQNLSVACPQVVQITEPTEEILHLRPGVQFPVLAAAYVRWRAEGLFPIIFHERPEMSLVEFIEWHCQPGVEAVGCYVGEKLAGIGWICQSKQVAGDVVAEVGAAFFRGTPMRHWHRFLDLLLGWGFAERGISAMYAMTPVPNRAGWVFAKRCGMRVSGSLPKFATWYGTAVDKEIYRLTIEEWRAYGQRRG
jgi:hypothetical protein